MGRLGEGWIAEAVSIDRRAEEWGPAATVANAATLLHRLDAAMTRASRDVERRPIHVAAAIAGAIAARTARWSGEDPSVALRVAMAHADAGRDGPAKSVVLLQEAAAIGEEARLSGLPCNQEKEAAGRALWQAGASIATSDQRAAARWLLAWEHAASGDEHGALHEADWAAKEAERAGWGYSIDRSYAEVLARCGHHATAQRHFTRALAAPPVVRILVLTGLARSEIQSGDTDAAATSLEEAVLLARSCRAPGRRRGIRTVRCLLPPGRHRDQLDDVLRG